MTFIWPVMLLLLAALPALVLLYVQIQRRRKRMLISYGNLGLAPAAGGDKGRLGAQRHIPPVLFLLALGLLILALARPKTVVSLPRVGGTVILAFDVSASMLADDMTPTRMEAAKVAARAFVERQPTTVQVGIVAFSEGGLAVQAPTNDRTALIGAINRLTPARGTSIANGILAALTAIEKAEQEEVTNYYSNRTPMPTPSPTPVPRGFLAPAAIVLLTDGENNVEPDPMVAAELAVERGVRIHTVGIGSPAGARLRIEGFSVHTKLDEAMLQQISHHTAGSYFNARSAEELLDIYQNLGSRFTVKPEETEVTALLAMAGLVVLLVGGALSLLWLGRLP